jgi:NADH dehydrogenase
LAQRPPSPARDTVVVVGAGLTGIELATELPKKLAQLYGAGHGHVILADSNAHIGSNMGEQATPVIGEALTALGVATRVNVAVASIDATGVTLASGERIATETVVWCAGMRASPLVAGIRGKHDRFGRLAVDEYMRVEGVPGVFAAGDCAWSLIDGTHATVMSCQHGRPMGRFAGHNVVADLVGQPMLPLRIDWYTTILDLGRWGALYTEGWDREVVSRGAPAKETKQIINCQRIYPPLTRNRDAILAAAAPVVSSPPQRFGDGQASAAPAAVATPISAK